MLRVSAEKALAIDPRVGEAHARLAQRAWAVGDKKANFAHWQRAAELEPNHPLVAAKAIQLALAAGHREEAILLQARTVELDPLSVVMRYNFALQLYADGRYEDTIAQMQQIAALNPSHPRGIHCASLVLLARLDDAQELAGSLADGADRQQCDALIHHARGERSRADAALARLKASSAASHAFQIAEVHAYRGETDVAFEWLERALAHCEATETFPKVCRGSSEYGSPLLASLYKDARSVDWQPRPFD